MSKAVLGQTLTVDAGERGARSLGEVHLQVREDIVRQDAQALMSLVNGQLIPWIVELNIGAGLGARPASPGSAAPAAPTLGDASVAPTSSLLPSWELTPPRQDDLALQLEIDRFFAERGLAVDENELYARFGRTRPD
jgi:hypothetical protein